MAFWWEKMVRGGWSRRESVRMAVYMVEVVWWISAVAMGLGTPTPTTFTFTGSASRVRSLGGIRVGGCHLGGGIQCGW